METFPVFQSAQRGLIDQDTCFVLLEAQLVRGGLLHPDSPQGLSLEKSFTSGLINSRIYQSLSEIEAALQLVQQSPFTKSHTIPVAAAMEVGYITEQIGLRILELQVSTGGFWDDYNNEILSLEKAKDKGLISAAVYDKLWVRLNRQELIDPNTAEKLSLSEFYQRCILNQETGLRLLPVNQQARGTICLRSGTNVGIFRAVQEGLIDQQVTIRLLEAQLFAGGITDPRTGHRLTVDEAVRHGLMDQDLACALLTHQLQSGGIIDPVNGERLELDESIQRNILSPCIALRVLESLWSFMGMLWPESGELLPINEALQQGVISVDLARRVLNNRHSIGAIYSPESGQLIPLGQAEKVLGLKAAEVLQNTQIPDILPAMTQTESLQHWGSSFTLPLSSLAPASLTHLQSDTFALEESRPQEKDLHYLHSYIMTHSYINAHSGERLVLLEPELMELINVTGTTKNLNKHKPHLKEPFEKEAAGEPDFMRSSSEPKQKHIRILVDGKKDSTFNISRDDKQGKHVPLEEDEMDIADMCKTAPKKAVQKVAGSSFNDTSNDSTFVKLSNTDSRISETKPEPSSAEHEPEQFLQLMKPNPWLEDEMPTSVSDKDILDENQVECAPYVKSLLHIKKENTAVKTMRKDTVEEGHPDQLYGNASEDLQVRKTEVSDLNKHVSAQTGTDRKMENAGTMLVDISEDTELDRMAKELLQGGLLIAGSKKLLPAEAVDEDMFPASTAVKIMSKAKLFGGFLNAHACQPLGIDDVIQEGLLDKDLMTKVIQSEKIMAGVFDVEHGRICSLREAAKEGLLDTDTVSHLLEAQVVSGGIVDFDKGKKVSVILAAKHGLIEDEQKDELLSLERSCQGKDSDPRVRQKKLKLQLQMNGIIDPKTKQPVSLQQAFQKGFISHEEAEQLLLQQIAEGGIVHHGSGIRLSVTDAVNQGLIDDLLAPKLKQFEVSRQNQFSSDPNAAFLQAAVGFIYDSASKSNLTLSQAVSCGVIDQDTANKAMDSSNVKSGVLDPQNACVVPYSELIKQGKIDIETGWRFFELKPFRGIPSKENGDLMTVPEAVKAGQVDRIPALRLLQSQADSGGIINISGGEKLPLLDAVDKSLVQKDVAMVIAKNLFLKGGLVNPVSGQRVSSLEEAVQNGLISKEMAAELCDNFGLLDHFASLSVSYQDSSTLRSCENLEVSTVHFASTQKQYLRTTDQNKDKLEAETDEQLQVLQHYPQSELLEQKHVDAISSGVRKDADVSLEVISQSVLKAERGLQKDTEECSPNQLTAVKPQQESRHILGKDYDIILQTTKPDFQIQPEVELTSTEIGINLENYGKSSFSIVPETTHKVLDGQAPSDKETNEIAKAAELQSVPNTMSVCKDSTDDGNDMSISTITEEQKMPGKKRGKGKQKKQTKICTESEKWSEVQLLDTNVTTQLQETEDKDGIVKYSDEKPVEPNLPIQVGMEFEIRQTSVVHPSLSSAHTEEFRSKVINTDHKVIKGVSAIKDLNVVTPTENAKGDHVMEVSIVQKSEHSSKTSDVNAVSPDYGTENKAIKDDLGIGREAVVTDQKSEDVEGEAEVDLKFLKSPCLSITSPIERMDTIFEKVAVANQESEGTYNKEVVKIDLGVIKASDLTETTLVEDIENKCGKEVDALDEKCVEELNELKEVKVDLEVLKPPCMSETSNTETTEIDFGKELVVTDQKPVADQKSEDLTMKEDVDLQAIKTADMAVVSLKEVLGDKSQTEITGFRQTIMKELKEVKVDVKVLQPINMGMASPVESMETSVKKDIVVTDQKSVHVKMKKKAKVDLKVIKGDKDTKDTSVKDTGGQKDVEKQREAKTPCKSITLPTDGTSKFENKVIISEQHDAILGNLDITKTPEEKEGSSAKHIENRFKKEFSDIDQKSIDEDVKVEKQIETETSGATDAHDSIESISEGLHQKIEVVTRQCVDNIILISKHDAANLVDDHSNRQDELQSKTYVEHEVDYSDLSDQSDKKRRKKRKNKKTKMVNTEKDLEGNKVDEPVQGPPVDVPSQMETFSVVRRDGMEQPQKPNQAQMEKETLLMKAKESILRKVFERGVSEKQAAEELEALRQGSAKDRLVTAQEKLKIDESSSLHAKENETDVIHQTKQKDKHKNLLPRDVLTGTDSTQDRFSQTDQLNANCYKKQDRRCTESSDVAMDLSKQISKPMLGLKGHVGETETKETEHLKSEKLGETTVPIMPSFTGEEKDHQKPLSAITLAGSSDSVPQSEVNMCVQTSKTGLEEPLQATNKGYSHIDSEFKDESSIEESSESRLSNLEEVPESDTTDCWEDEDDEGCQEGVDEKQAADLAKKQKRTPQISKVRLYVYPNSAFICFGAL